VQSEETNNNMKQTNIVLIGMLVVAVLAAAPSAQSEI